MLWLIVVKGKEWNETWVGRSMTQAMSSAGRRMFFSTTAAPSRDPGSRAEAAAQAAEAAARAVEAAAQFDPTAFSDHLLRQETLPYSADSLSASAYRLPVAPLDLWKPASHRTHSAQGAAQPTGRRSRRLSAPPTPRPRRVVSEEASQPATALSPPPPSLSVRSPRESPTPSPTASSSSQGLPTRAVAAAGPKRRMEGYLFVRQLRSFIRRWCVLVADKLFMFEYYADARPYAVASLRHCIVQHRAEKWGHEFKVYHAEKKKIYLRSVDDALLALLHGEPGAATAAKVKLKVPSTKAVVHGGAKTVGLVLREGKHSIVLRAGGEKLMFAWIAALRDAISEASFSEAASSMAVGSGVHTTPAAVGASSSASRLGLGAPATSSSSSSMEMPRGAAGAGALRSLLGVAEPPAPTWMGLAVCMAGWLDIQQQRYWARRWFVLVEHRLLLFRLQSHQLPHHLLGALSLEQATVSRTAEPGGLMLQDLRGQPLYLVPEGSTSLAWLPLGSKAVCHLRAPSESLAVAWAQLIRSCARLPSAVPMPLRPSEFGSSEPVDEPPGASSSSPPQDGAQHALFGSLQFVQGLQNHERLMRVRPETTNWLSVLLRRIAAEWHALPLIEDSLQTWLTDRLQLHAPKYLEAIRVEAVHRGLEPLDIGDVRFVEIGLENSSSSSSSTTSTSTGSSTINMNTMKTSSKPSTSAASAAAAAASAAAAKGASSSSPSFSGNSSSHANQGQSTATGIVGEMDVSYSGDFCLEISARLVVDWPIQLGLRIPVLFLVHLRRLAGTLLISMPDRLDAPYSAAFSCMPDLDLDFEAIFGEDFHLSYVESLYQYVLTTLKRAIKDQLVSPARFQFSSPFSAWARLLCVDKPESELYWLKTSNPHALTISITRKKAVHAYYALIVSQSKWSIIDELFDEHVFISSGLRESAAPYDGVLKSSSTAASALRTVRSHVSEMQDALVGLKFLLLDLSIQNDRVWCRWEALGRWTKDYWGFPPTNRTIKAFGVSCFHFNQGRIHRLIEYWDVDAIVDHILSGRSNA